MADTTIHTIPHTLTPFIAAEIRKPGLLKWRWLYHLLFWLSYYSLTVILYLSLHENLTLNSYIMIFLTLVIQAPFAYVNLYFLIPRLLFTRRYVYYTLALLLIAIACSGLNLLMEQAYATLIEKKLPAKLHILTFSNGCIGFVQIVYILGMVTGIKFVKDTLLNQQRQKEREKHYLETELKFLKSQIQPHFFFNTLNNLYSLTLKKSDLAPDIVLKLSDLMSYMLYESSAPLVPLKKEIEYLQNYLDVEQLRFGQRLSVAFTIEGQPEEVSIPPMILILFLENSFKHGVKNNISHILLTISLKIADGSLWFHVENPLSEEEKAGENNGIGLKNVRRRLDLLYGESYTLDIREQDKLFTVSLKMPLC